MFSLLFSPILFSALEGNFSTDGFPAGINVPPAGAKPSLRALFGFQTDRMLSPSIPVSAGTKAGFHPWTCLHHSSKTAKEMGASGSSTGAGKEKGKEVIENREEESEAQPQCDQKMK